MLSKTICPNCKLDNGFMQATKQTKAFSWVLSHQVLLYVLGIVMHKIRVILKITLRHYAHTPRTTDEALIAETPQGVLFNKSKRIENEKR
jgi:hypothetical protein